MMGSVWSELYENKELNDKLYEVVVITDWIYEEPIIDTTHENSQQVAEDVSVEETSVNLEE